ncbi:MAG: SPASM domain-containing protein [Magnetococcales bacterium]|nr:SPASM domain-containing protein [Magnetococcales bacterium]
MAEMLYSQLRTAGRASLADLLPLKFPMSMYVETTNRCNLRCTYCPLSLPDYKDRVGGFLTLSMEDFTKICRDIQEGGRLKVLRFYFMGEPLVNPHLPEMIALARRMEVAERLELTSNGVLLDEKRSLALLDSGLDYLRISISSVDPVRHAKVTATKVKVETIRQNVLAFRRLRDGLGMSRPFLYVKMLQSESEEENQAFIHMYQKVADEICLEKPMNWDNRLEYDLIKATYGEENKLDLTASFPYPKAVCPFPFYTLVVSVNGDVTVCCVDWNKDTKVGNIHESTLSEIWQGERLRQLRLLHLNRQRDQNPSCCNCNFLYTTPDNLDELSNEKRVAMVGLNQG